MLVGILLISKLLPSRHYAVVSVFALSINHLERRAQASGLQNCCVLRPVFRESHLGHIQKERRENFFIFKMSKTWEIGTS